MNNEMMKSVLMIAVFFAIIYFLMIRPQKKREKAVKTMRDTLQVGDEVITIGGFIGKIMSVKGDTLIMGRASSISPTVSTWPPVVSTA